MSTFVCMTVIKTTLTATAKVYFNDFAAYSGFHYVDDMLFSLYPVIYTQYFFYNWFEINVPNQFWGKEELLPFKMSENYAHSRDNIIRRLLKTYAWYTLFIYISGFFGFYVTFKSSENITG